MSGGFYDYMYGKEPIDAMGQYDDLHDMAEVLIDLGCEKEANHFAGMFAVIKDAESEMQSFMDVYAETMRAIEWFKSGDVGEDWIHECIRKAQTGEQKKRNSL